MSRYDEFLAELKEKHNLTARDALRKLYAFLTAEDPNLSKEDMYDRILKDCLNIWARHTIIQNMPQELKDSERQESGRKGAEKKKELIVTNDGNVATGTVANPAQKKENSQIGSAQRHDTNGQRKKQAQVSQDETLGDDIDDDANIAKETRDGELTKDERIAQLEDALKQANLFNKAADIQKVQTETKEVILPERLLSAMFLTLRNGEKKCIYCTVEGNEISRIEGHSMRMRAQSRGQGGAAKK